MKHSIVETENFNELKKSVEEGKIVFAPFCGGVDCEDQIKEKTKGANSRCFPIESKDVSKKKKKH